MLKGNYMDFVSITPEEISFDEYEKMEKSNVEDVKIVLSDPLDMNYVGFVLYTFSATFITACHSYLSQLGS